jgi:hypothetical protein
MSVVIVDRFVVLARPGIRLQDLFGLPPPYSIHQNVKADSLLTQL